MGFVFLPPSSLFPLSFRAIVHLRVPLRSLVQQSVYTRSLFWSNEGTESGSMMVRRADVSVELG